MAWVNLNTIYATKSEVNSKVPNTRTINGKALSSNVTLGASDIKLSDDTTLQSAWDSISQLEDDLKTLTKKFNTLNGCFSFTSGLSGIAFHAWDGGFQIATKGGAQQKIATFDSNGINFYLDGKYTWHK